MKLSTKRQIITLLSGTVLLFIWNAVSWMVLPFHANSLKNIPAEAFQQETMKNAMPESGVYHYPGLPDNFSKTALREIEGQLKAGPRIPLMVYINEPTALFDPMTFIRSLFFNFTTVLVMLVLFIPIADKSKHHLPFSLLVGAVAILVSDISLMNWYMFPLGFTLVNAIDKLVSFGLIGILFATFTFKNGNYDR